MLTANDAIAIVADLIAKCHANEPHDLGRAVWAALTDPDARAHDLTYIAVTAIALCSVAMDHTGLGVEPTLDQLRFEATWNTIAAQLEDPEGNDDGD